ncbi:Coronin-2A [Pteropus alecto]|uniref:Coronin n=1 Tax=Pteropus alecto TaxID=9402 RepID=L5KP43_PTEAL|nr:Coronin-2A [Pteropus alecto]
MSWHPQYRSSKFRHVFGKPASKENCYDSVPITHSVHDNHFCAVNPHFIAVVTECAGGGAFLVIPLHQTGKLDPHYPKVCGHRGNVLDIKWNPFDDFEIASCSEDTMIKIWDIPKQLLSRNLTACRKELVGHSRRVGLVEWHPTAANILFSAGYDYKVMVWNLDTKESVIKSPVKTIDCHQDVILSMSFNTNGSLLATTCKDRKIRVLDPRAGSVLQEASYKGHRASKVLFLGNLKKLLSTGTSRWNNRQMALWDQDDLSVPLTEEDLDGSSGVLFPFYDTDTNMLYVVMVWNLDTKESVIKSPVKTIDCHQDVILSMSFNTNGSLLATTCKDRKIRVLDPRAGSVLQEASYKGHRASKVLFLGNLKKLLSTGTSRWNNRQMALWDQDDLSVPLTEEDLDGSSGVLFPFYDTDTNMLYVVGKGDGNIRYYEVSADKPYLNYLTEYRSYHPQKGIGVMPKRGLDVSSCEIFRFYKLITTKSLIEPVSMIVPRRSESYQEDIYPPTAGAQPSLTAREWLNGMNKERPLLKPVVPASPQLFNQTEKLVAKDGRRPFSLLEEKAPRWAAEHKLEEKKTWLTNGFDIFECPPPKTENELLQMFYRQQEEIRRLRELVTQREVQAKQLELEIKNLKMSSEWF